MYNDELRAIMKDYDITPEEIRRMLELYARGGSATITKRRVNPSTGLQEVKLPNKGKIIRRIIFIGISIPYRNVLNVILLRSPS